jgi:hypothetical protein
MTARIESFLVVLLVAFAFACGGGEKRASAPPANVKKAPAKLPTAAEAQQLIEASSDFGQLEFDNTAVTLPMKKSAMNAPQLDNAKQLAAAGWLKFNGDDVELTKGKDDGRFNVRGNGFMDVVPVAKKKMGAVTSVRTSPDGAEADFTWQWEPTEVGTAFKHGDVRKLFGVEHHSVATFLWDGSTWSVLHIR